MIEGVQVIPLKQIHDERGKIMHMLRADASHFKAFGEVYFSTIHPGVVKAWHKHKKMTLNYAVPYGKVKLVLYDGRESSPTFKQVQEIFLSPDNYQLVIIPPEIWNGFKGVGEFTSIVANCADFPHDPEEIERLEVKTDQIPYEWDLEHK
jgi:dTDP-4-dehydrorhamnose 3,5-epimerase